MSGRRGSFFSLPLTPLGPQWADGATETFQEREPGTVYQLPPGPVKRGDSGSAGESLAQGHLQDRTQVGLPLALAPAVCPPASGLPTRQRTGPSSTLGGWGVLVGGGRGTSSLISPRSPPPALGWAPWVSRGVSPPGHRPQHWEPGLQGWQLSSSWLPPTLPPVVLATLAKPINHLHLPIPQECGGLIKVSPGLNKQTNLEASKSAAEAPPGFWPLSSARHAAPPLTPTAPTTTEISEPPSHTHPRTRRERCHPVKPPLDWGVGAQKSENCLPLPRASPLHLLPPHHHLWHPLFLRTRRAYLASSTPLPNPGLCKPPFILPKPPLILACPHPRGNRTWLWGDFPMEVKRPEELGPLGGSGGKSLPAPILPSSTPSSIPRTQHQ